MKNIFNNLLINDMYIKWLNNYMKINNDIDTLHFINDKLDSSDVLMIKLLENLYEELNIYCPNNRLNCYYLKYKDNYYMIKYDGKCYYCKRYSENIFIEGKNIGYYMFITFPIVEYEDLINKKVLSKKYQI